VYVVADGTAMAVEDLKRDWGHERRPAWAIDTGLPATGDLTPELVAALTPEAKARLIAMAQAEGTCAADPRHQSLERLLRAYRDRLGENDRGRQTRTTAMEI
jgi:hypothetical protein